jgi:hypothetical protein
MTRLAISALALLVATFAAACSHAALTSDATAVPVYPGVKVEAASGAFSTSDSFATVYTWYKKNLPSDSHESRVTSPAEAALFSIGSGDHVLNVTITTSPLCCKTLIVIARRA